MNESVIFFTVLVISGFFIPPEVLAQPVAQEAARQKTVTVDITETGKATVIHEVAWNKKSQLMETVSRAVSNLTITDAAGNQVRHEITDGEEPVITIFPTNQDVKVEYDAEPGPELIGDTWVWEFLYLESTYFVLPEGVNTIFANERPVFLGESSHFRCHGCQLRLEYHINGGQKTYEVQYEEEEFNVGVKTPAEISVFAFDQPTRRISFTAVDGGLFVIVIPLDLLGGPYQAYLNDKKILYNEFFKNETHASLGFKLNGAGIVDIIGTTVIPEFPVFMPLAVGILMIITLQYGSRVIRR